MADEKSNTSSNTAADTVIDAATVRQIAHLAQLQIEDDECDAVTRKLRRALAFIREIRAVDVGDARPMSDPLDRAQFLRADQVTEAPHREEFLRLAPKSEAGLYLVPKVIE